MRISPVNGDLAIEHAVELAQLAFGDRRRLVIDELEEAEAAVLDFVVGGRGCRRLAAIEDDQLGEAFCSDWKLKREEKNTFLESEYVLNLL